MNTGYWFFPDTVILSESRHSVFRYKRVSITEEHSTSLDFPVYVALEPDQIRFFFDGNEPGNNRHHHYCVLSLPLKRPEEVESNLASALREEIRVDPESYRHILPGDADQTQSYSYLHNTLPTNAYPVTHQLFQTKMGSWQQETLPIWVLLLDFLFDLRHSTVFQRYPAFNELLNTLEADPLLHALLKKCEYYYCQLRYQEDKTAWNNADNTFKPFKSKLLHASSNELQEAEKKWLHFILRDQDNHPPEFGEGWLYPSEQELRAVLFNDDIHKKHIFDRSIIKRVCNKWPPQNKKVFWRSEWIVDHMNLVSNGEEQIHPRQTREEVYRFFISRFGLFAAWRFFVLNLSWGWIFYVLLIALIVLEVWFGLNDELFGLFALPGAFFGLLIPFVAFVRVVARYAFKLARRILNWIEPGIIRDWKQAESYSFALALPNLTLGILGGWFALMPFAEEAWALNLSVSDTAVTIGFIGLMSFSLMVIFNTIKTLVPTLPGFISVIRSSSVLFAGISFSLCCGLGTMGLLGQSVFNDPLKFLPHERQADKLNDLNAMKDSIYSVIFMLEEMKDYLHSQPDSIQAAICETAIQDADNEVCSLYAKFLPQENHFCGGLAPAINKYWNDAKTSANPDSTLCLCIYTCKQTWDAAYDRQRKVYAHDLIRSLEEQESFWLCPNSLDCLHFPVRGNNHNHCIFFFPRLLLIYSAITFFIGFFIQVTIQRLGYNQPV